MKMNYFQHLLISSLWVVVIMLAVLENGCNGCLEKERIALLQLKDSINFPNRTWLPSWEEDDSMDCCHWERVECNSTTRRVIKLELNNTREWRDGDWLLNASILLPFESLRSLDLSRNRLRSFVGNEGTGILSNLTNLEELDLSKNNLGNGILPSLNKLSNLKFLRLASNNLNGSIYVKALGPISKTQNTQARESACEEILAQAVRNAPTLLGYEPSYKGVLKKKEKKKKNDEPGARLKQKEGTQPSSKTVSKRKTAAPSTEGSKRQKGVRLPKIGYTAAEWLTPLGADEVIPPRVLGFNTSTRLLKLSEEEMSRRNVQRPPIPSKPLNPVQGRASAEQQQKEKKQKTSHDLSAPSVSKAIQVVDSASDPREKELLVNPHVDLIDTQVEAAVLRPFSPCYTMPDGRVLMLKDSVKEEPNLAVTLLRGLALPRDCDQVPSDLLPSLAEMCSHFVQAGQAALKAYDKAEKVQAERERFRSDRESYKAKWRSTQKELKEEEAEVERLKKELAESKAAAASSEATVKRLMEEEKEKMKQADLKGYEAGIHRASLEYTRTAYKMVNEALEGRLPDFYRRGYASGAQEMAGVMAIQAESGFLKQLPEPIVPDLDLPYTEEDCAPLPPESEGDEDMAEASQKDDLAEADDAEKAAVAEDQQEDAAVENP